MCLREMKTLFSSILFLFILVQASAQSNISFFSKEYHSRFDFKVDSSAYNVSALRFSTLSSDGFREDKNSTLLYGLSLKSGRSNKIKVSASFDVLKGSHSLRVNEIKDSLGVLPGFGRDNTRWMYALDYKANKFITLSFGKGKHFIGNGYRSLFLSDELSPYPYLKVKTEFGRVKYYNLFTTFLDIQDKGMDRKKHASIHYLDVGVGDYVNIAVFEGVIWQANSEDYNRAYDVEYLNPVIFYRPVEFSKHSPDNVLMGASLNVSFKKTMLYMQVLLDDLNIARQKDRDANFSTGFFQNKFAYQLGIKTQYKMLTALLEYNQAQPYTYAHKEPMQSYTHVNHALAHPLGANFKELVTIVGYAKGKLKLKLKATIALVGLDSLGTHFGQNIFASDFDAERNGDEYSYGNFNGQGVLTHLSTIQPEISYKILGFDVFFTTFYSNKKSDLIDQTSISYSFGIRTFPFVAAPDY